MNRTFTFLALASVLSTLGFAQPAGRGVHITLTSNDSTFSKRGWLHSREELVQPRIVAEIRKELERFFPYWNFEPKDPDAEITITFLATPNPGDSTITLTTNQSVWTSPPAQLLPGGARYPFGEGWIQPVATAVRTILDKGENRRAIVEALRDVPISSRIRLPKAMPSDPDATEAHAEIVPFRFPNSGYPAENDCFDILLTEAGTGRKYTVLSRGTGASPNGNPAERSIEVRLYKAFACGGSHPPVQLYPPNAKVEPEGATWSGTIGPLRPRTRTL